jgi:hypothetical protein
MTHTRQHTHVTHVTHARTHTHTHTHRERTRCALKWEGAAVPHHVRGHTAGLVLFDNDTVLGQLFLHQQHSFDSLHDEIAACVVASSTHVDERE